MSRTSNMPFFSIHEPLKFALGSLVSQWHIALCFILLCGIATFLLDKNRAVDVPQHAYFMGVQASQLHLLLEYALKSLMAVLLVSSALSMYKTGKIRLHFSMSFLVSAVIVFLINIAWSVVMQLVLYLFKLVESYQSTVVLLLFGFSVVAIKIYILFRFMFMIPYLIDKKSSLAESIKKSFELTYQYKYKFTQSLFAYIPMLDNMVLSFMLSGLGSVVVVFLPKALSVMESVGMFITCIIFWIFFFEVTYVYCTLMADYENNEHRQGGDLVDQKLVNE